MWSTRFSWASLSKEIDVSQVARLPLDVNSEWLEWQREPIYLLFPLEAIQVRVVSYKRKHIRLTC